MMCSNQSRLQSPTLGVLPPVRPVVSDRGSSVLYSAIIMKASPGTYKQEIELAFPGPSSHNHRMKNKENYTVKQLTDKITELCAVKYPTDHSMKWAYTCGILEAMMDWEIKGYSKNVDTFQDRVNQAFERYEKELEAELAVSA